MLFFDFSAFDRNVISEAAGCAQDCQLWREPIEGGTAVTCLKKNTKALS